MNEDANEIRPLGPEEIDEVAGADKPTMVTQIQFGNQTLSIWAQSDVHGLVWIGPAD
ncbi:hypothetical protein [Labrys wisconsinensis]|jgi:hypothetical protein|uniref:Uncharacterized protein n=1 Tax=Labrys wisconsinensis TaxID=425677 RepID=A0ABU0JG34_9HYPH|nr:hypothetical protein [Labrys wisconsinensis]MDQ0472441.1 hypothetical protein [Labrys wisconsinensis]